jgi:hypothetical protein
MNLVAGTDANTDDDGGASKAPSRTLVHVYYYMRETTVNRESCRGGEGSWRRSMGGGH